MNMKALILAVAAVSAAAGFSQSKDSVAAESTPASNMASRTKDKTRDPGLFGDYWWANRFLSRHMEIEIDRTDGKNC
jgi:hypothetical protein